MERPSKETIEWYESAIPADDRVKMGQMFAHPCSFVNGNMFFGTFAQSVVARVGAERARALVSSGAAKIFEPMEGRAWKEYIQLELGSVPKETLAAYAREALEVTAELPAKAKKGSSTPKKKAAQKSKKA
ncbi:MAG: hypothetical protein HY791_38460 [Deltaproteobacteria bacterium]|nr:hypothetical protein [Deltaproteobacteria bacterium]